MKTRILSLTRRFIFLGILSAAAFLSGVAPVRGGVTFALQVSHHIDETPIAFYVTNYQILIYDVEADGNLPQAPAGNYTISSPTGQATESFDFSSAGTSNFTGYGSAVFSDYNSFIQELTNGNWTITVSNGSTTIYSFHVSAPGLTSNTLANVNVTFPVNGSTGVTNEPVFTWQGITWGSGDIQVEDYDYSGTNFFLENFLTTSATSWPSPTNLPAGPNTFLIFYNSSISSAITATTPTNSASQPISSWTFDPFLSTYTIISFTVTNAPAGPPSLAAALNTTNLTWTTSGNANWFGETNVSHDGVSAARSGAITGSQTSTLQTTITGPGSLTFWWQTSEPTGYLDLEFDLDGGYVDDIDGTTAWTQEPSVYIPSGTHTLTWTAYGDGPANTNDAGWVDQVQFTPSGASNGPVSVEMSVTIERYRDETAGTTYYYAYPYISSMTPAPVTTNRMVSSDGQMIAYVYTGQTSDNYSEGAYTTLDQAIYACTNGQWTLYVNEGDPSQQVFYFSMSLNSLTTNLLSQVTILSPAPNAMNVASNAVFQWSGPTNASSVFVEAYQELPSFAFDGYTNLATNATSWAPPTGLLTGTNYFYIQYGLYSFTGYSFTTPVDTNSNPIASWNPGFYLYSVDNSQFSVRNPLAVQITNAPPQTSGGNFQLGFQTVPGRTETVQMRTNLLTGTWVDVTNFVGDGSSYQLSVPITNSPGKYFRVITQ